MVIKGHTAIESYEMEKYFFIKSQSSKEYMPIEEFYRLRHEKNPRLFFDKNSLNSCKFKYRGEELRYKDLCMKEIMELDIAEFHIKYGERGQIINPVNIKSMDGDYFKKNNFYLCLFETLDRYINKASYEAKKAATILDLDFLNSDTNCKKYYWQYMLRCNYAENAIYSYYAAFEILMMIIYVVNNYCNKESSIEEIYTKFKMNYFLKKLKQDENSKIDKYEITDGKDILRKFKLVRDWCNAFKHRGILRFDGEKKEKYVHQNIQYDNKTYKLNDDSFMHFIDLDKEVLPEIINYHNCIVSLSEKVLQVILEEMFS